MALFFSPDFPGRQGSHAAGGVAGYCFGAHGDVFGDWSDLGLWFGCESSLGVDADRCKGDVVFFFSFRKRPRYDSRCAMQQLNTDSR